MGSLTAEEFDAVNAVAGGSVLATAVARLYYAEGSAWSYAEQYGAATLVESGGSVYIRLIDLFGQEILFEQELYYNFDYQIARPFFHTFEAEESIVGFSFADESDASAFQSSLFANMPSGQPRSSFSAPPHTPSKPPGGNPPPPSRPAATPPARPPLESQGSSAKLPPPTPAPAPAPASHHTPAPKVGPMSNQTSPGIPKKKVEKKKGGFFSKAIGFAKSNLGLEEEQMPDVEISVDHSTFRHESHIGWDPANGFEIRNIPPQWRKLFQAAGVKKSELRDAETAKFIMDTVAEATVGINPTAGGPPPLPPSHHGPPTPGGGAPPPPAGGGPPPPPAGGGPPPPAGGGPPPPAGGGPPPPSAAGGGGSSGGLLAGLSTVKLKSADERAVPDISEISESESGTLAGTLAKAMEARREAISVDSDDFDSEDEWSD